MYFDQIADPLSAIAEDDLLCRTAPASIPGLQIQPATKLLGGFDGADIGGGIRIADGETFLVPFGLGEHASQFGLTRTGRLSIGLALASLGFFLHYRYPS